MQIKWINKTALNKWTLIYNLSQLTLNCININLGTKI